MDKRVKKPIPPDVAVTRREKFYADIANGSLTIPEAVVAMRKISRLTCTKKPMGIARFAIIVHK